MEETSDSATFGQSILATKGERLSAMVIPAESLPPSSFLPSPFISFLLSPFSLLLSSSLSLSFSFLICHFSFLCLSPFIGFLLLLAFSFPFLISHFIVFLILSSFSFYLLSHFVAQISANVNIYRIDSSFLHIICAFLA